MPVQKLSEFEYTDLFISEFDKCNEMNINQLVLLLKEHHLSLKVNKHAAQILAIKIS